MGLFKRNTAFGASSEPAPPTAPNDGPVSLRKAIGVSLTKFPNVRRKWAVYVVADQSGSMFFRGFMPKAVEYIVDAVLQATALGGWDADGKIPLIPMATRAARPMTVQLGETGVGRRLQDHGNRNNIGAGTRYSDAVHVVRDDYRSSTDYGHNPAVVFFIVDGEDGNTPETVRELTEASNDPIHWVLLFFGSKDSHEAATVRALDDGTLMPNRKTDNVSVFYCGDNPLRVNVQDLADGLMAGPSAWLIDAPRDGVRIPG